MPLETTGEAPAYPGRGAAESDGGHRFAVIRYSPRAQKNRRRVYATSDSREEAVDRARWAAILNHGSPNVYRVCDRNEGGAKTVFEVHADSADYDELLALVYDHHQRSLTKPGPAPA